ncbi:hypothetical protein DICSQDRAFT_172180 [Dichomitus squalens LYAD-421 SS1]|uniref:Uncharacterized protein n=1 Tax=Dichomitus squalens (strain LYAD-421) TaxID=732165 RepID=R7STJ4_DICSQ|nr:uncharacterized protein DICSQDRAFT_172180 [Dichomitus squalens LYAD-421 SS1]EJF59391.1 hypothetical protein DICSQDRAFT_172180 [Dichomitus squalens LYAD-421 SS1]
MRDPLPQPPSLPHDTERNLLGLVSDVPQEMATPKTPVDDADAPRCPVHAARVVESAEPLNPRVNRYDPANWSLFTPATQRDKHLERAQNLLIEWRNKTWLALYKSQPFGAPGILPDTVINSGL